MKRTLLAGLLLTAFSAPAAQPYGPLDIGTFHCRSHTNRLAVLQVKQHPTKPEKAILNWEGRDRIVHRVNAKTTVLRYEGEVSKLLYIQIPTGSRLFDENKMEPILTDCIFQ
jgi:hypothetical protein